MKTAFACAIVILLACPADAAAREFSTAWMPSAQRAPLGDLGIGFEDHDGRHGVLRDVIDRPTLITFFYTRCQNAKKCSMAVSRLGALQRQLDGLALDDDVRLLAISYEPQFDTPERLHRFATERGLRVDDDARALRLDEARQREMVDAFQAPANYNAGWVNTHGVELNLLDAQGRLVRKYQTLLWDNDEVLADIKRVLAEAG